MLKSLSADSISSIAFLSCGRPIEYSQRDHNLHLSDLNKLFIIGAIGVKENCHESSAFSFVIHCQAGGGGGGGGGDNDVILRTDNVEKLSLLINAIAAAAGLEH